ncbi:hypothetical protein HL658_35405 [Azospirillum sp. RWY-5-1]|uniref:Methyl-accepting chemotaxis protein n=1 Tax=Azospirillum oleiclasticum TaxID=2735135 RepID=A0ABX2TL40_9PROT|nr:methyl-accepting chemotaxis protein [Azospirillum oleiclasticum]NYZ17859.1 hypothetical protein [Azospirillum oleiclasticum]NYZ25067.1 hypothetical protein [Azospirillum oleiclasticum]
MTRSTALLANLSFSIKFALAPLLAVIMIAGVAYVGVSGLDRQVRTTRDIVDLDLKRATELEAVAGRVQRANGTLFRLMTNQAGGVAGGNLAAEIATLGGDVDRLIADLDAIKSTLSDQAQVSAIGEVTKELTTYKGAVEFVGSMMEIDFASTVSFLQPFTANFERMSRLIQELVDSMVAESDARARQAAAEAGRTEQVFLGVVVAAVTLTLGFAIGLGRATAGSVRRIADATHGLAEGNRAIDVAALRRRDELGAIVESLAVFRDAMEATDRMKAEQEAMMAQAEVAKRKALDDMARLFETDVQSVIDGLIRASADMRGSADRMARTADETSRQTEVVVRATDEATASVNDAAGAAEQMASSISEIARQVGTSAEVARSAVQEVNRTNDTVEGLNRAAAKIGEVIGLIGAIASQTNLLALNATIEAARAGEAGKGFAVVASEVKNLASQTAKATEDIAQQVAAIQGSTGTAVTAIQGVGRTIARMNEISSAVAAAVDEQNAVTAEIARAVQTASGRTQQVSATVGEFSVAAAETGRAAAAIQSTTETLTGNAHALQDSVRQFLGRVRGSNAA